MAVDDAKPNVSVCQCSFGRVAARTSYINQCLHVPKELLGLVVILPVPLCNIYGGHGSILVYALTFYYYYNNSCNTGIELSSVQLSGTQHSSVHSVLSTLISADQH